MNNQFEKRLAKLEAAVPTTDFGPTMDEVDEMARLAFTAERLEQYKEARAICDADGFPSMRDLDDGLMLTEKQKEALFTLDDLLWELGV